MEIKVPRVTLWCNGPNICIYIDILGTYNPRVTRTTFRDKRPINTWCQAPISCIINNMGTQHTGISTRNPLGDGSLLTDQHENMCALVASGMSYRRAAELVGFQADSGWSIMQNPGMLTRVAALAADPIERVRAGIDADICMIRRRLQIGDVDAEERATLALRLKACMDHAKLRGWIVNRQQIDKRSVDLSLVGSAELQEHLSGVLDTLEPGARREIDQRLAAVKKRRKAAQRAKGKSVTVDVEATEDEDE